MTIKNDQTEEVEKSEIKKSKKKINELVKAKMI